MDNNIKSKNQTLEYSSEKYSFRVEYNKRKNCFIELFVEKENIIDGYFYNTKMNFSEFTESKKLFRFCDNLEEIYNLISKLIDENLVSIKEIINDNQLILLLKMFVSGSEEPLTAKIKLLKNKFDQSDLINKLYERIEELTFKEHDIDGVTEMLSEKIDKLEGELKAIKKENSELKKNIINIKNDINIQIGDYKTKVTKRNFTRHIDFDKIYENIPHVMTSLNGIQPSNIGWIHVNALNITTTGFDLKITSGENHANFMVQVSWISFN
ncbi:hypothetical protein BCR32DRAFT_246560 [Anaeromyces robustus]|uniref:H-type lectin domain-containing protein n=1 Tax=Anaeromyces robustus TaxID=1754192 RepID=A0A1Y1X076_9FUNG|nr:hypothetical protein BCR32DRAFT_246560 [Anaeromyces robustus]|eukprot:ORX79221.1 hypothetical protein BCR32DRAFT_246560 [Anaeromyces robustus]